MWWLVVCIESFVMHYNEVWLSSGWIIWLLVNRSVLVLTIDSFMDVLVKLIEFQIQILDGQHNYDLNRIENFSNTQFWKTLWKYHVYPRTCGIFISIRQTTYWQSVYAKADKKCCRFWNNSNFSNRAYFGGYIFTPYLWIFILCRGVKLLKLQPLPI